MLAAWITAPCPPAGITVGELPVPVPGPQQVLVQVAAVAVNPIDTYVRSGKYPLPLPMPFIIGRDLTGTVVETGAEVTHFRPGDRVWCNNQGYAGRQGTFAEFAAIDEGLLYHLPDEADLIESVATLHSALTASLGLEKVRPQAGETVFIRGGDGNVGTAVLQLARAAGARVAVTAGSEEKARWCEELGAELVIRYRETDIPEALHQFAPAGVDVYWETTPQPELKAMLSVLAQRGRMVLMSGLKHQCEFPVGEFYTRNATLFGFTVTDAADFELAGHAERIREWLSGGQLRARIHRVLPLAAAAEAHRMMEEERLFGKVVVRVGV